MMKSMLPPGHIGAGYLVSYALLAIGKPVLTSTQIQMILWLGMFFGFAPDLDMFFSFKQLGSLTLAGAEVTKTNHRHYITHAPIIWLVAGLGIYWLAPTPFISYVGLTVWLGSWSHFVLDSLQYGIMWLWPFSTRRYALKDRDMDVTVHGKGFFNYWTNFLLFYIQKVGLTFYTEIIILIVALIVFLSSQGTAFRLF